MPYTPAIGITGMPIFDPQFTVTTLDIHSFASTPIEYFDLQGNLLENIHATGFFYRFDGKVFLVTARHVLSGADTFTNEIISSTGYIPFKIRVYPHLNVPVQHHRLQPVTLTVRDDNENPRWLEDPQFEKLRTDIACIELNIEDQARIACTNDAANVDLFANSGVDCFVIGYPSKNYHDPYPPIWRRGSLASEPLIPIDNKPIFLVDAMTSPGMSGSQIIQRWHGPPPISDGKGGITVDMRIIVSSRFIGVYGGRLTGNAALAEIGYGWYANRVPVILANRPT